jgi:hypothetical protein
MPIARACPRKDKVRMIATTPITKMSALLSSFFKCFIGILSSYFVGISWIPIGNKKAHRSGQVLLGGTLPARDNSLAHTPRAFRFFTFTVRAPSATVFTWGRSKFLFGCHLDCTSMKPWCEDHCLVSRICFLGSLTFIEIPELNLYEL